MCFVEEEHHLRQLLVAGLGQQLIEFAQQPEQEGGIQIRLAEQAFRRQDVDGALAVLVPGQPVRQVQGGLAEEIVAALVFQDGDGALDRADGGLGDIAVVEHILLRVVAHIGQHGLQVLEVDQQHALVIRDAEHQVQNAGLGIIEAEHAGQKQRAHFGHSGADRHTALAEHIPERHRRLIEGEIGDAALFQTGVDLLAALAGLGQAGQVTLHVRQEHRDA